MSNLNKFLNPLFLIVGVPILFVAIVAIMVYLPASLAQPQYDFVYMSSDDYYYSTSKNFFVQDGKIQAHILPSTAAQRLANKNFKESEEGKLKSIRTAQFFIFDVKDNVVKPVSFEEVSKLRVNPSLLSPDGYEFIRSKRGGGIVSLFSFNSRGSVYVLKKRLVVIELPIGNQRVKFMGWIVN